MVRSHAWRAATRRRDLARRDRGAVRHDHLERRLGGGLVSDSTTAVRGVDKLIPVDVYIPGCPPRPEAIFDAINKLRKKVANESIQERSITQQTHRYYSTPHQLKVVDPILTGKYLQQENRSTPPKALTEAMGMPVPPALAISQEQEATDRG